MNFERKEKKWIAIYTKPKHEKSVEKELQNKGVEVFLPMLRERRKWSDRKKWVSFPLFRSYIFVKIEIKNSLFVLQTKGVVKIVKFHGKIAVVPSESIHSIRLMIDGGYNPKPTDYFIKGDPVKIKDGPLIGLRGEVTRIDNKDCLIIRIDAIQHSISIKINRAFLSKL